MQDFDISQHAYDRFLERLGRVEVVPSLYDEIKNSYPIGAQKGNSFLRSLPCGLVAAGTHDKITGMKVVCTILTLDQAVANMQAGGFTFTVPVRDPTIRVHEPKEAKRARKSEKKTVPGCGDRRPEIVPQVVMPATPEAIERCLAAQKRISASETQKRNLASEAQKSRIKDLCEQYQIEIDTDRLQNLTQTGFVEWSRDLMKYRGRDKVKMERRSTLAIMSAFHAICAIRKDEKRNDLENESITDRDEIEDYRLAFRAAMLTFQVLRELLKTAVIRSEHSELLSEFVWGFLDSLAMNQELVVEVLDKIDE